MNPLWILTFHRSGSSHLTTMLNSIKANGKRIFSPPIREWYGQTCLSSFGKPKTPPINCKLHNGSRAAFKLTPEKIESASGPKDPKYIILERHDPISQAISAYIVGYTKITNIFKNDPKELDKFRKIPIPLDITELKKIYLTMLSKTADPWINWLGGRPYKLFTYKQLIENKQCVITSILKYIKYTGIIDSNPTEKYIKLEHPSSHQLRSILQTLIQSGKLPKVL